MATYKENIAAITQGMVNLLERKGKTEAQALAESVSKPNVIYYTSDTHSIVIGGNIYGRGAEMMTAFKYASSAQDTSNWNTNYLYIVPESQQNYNIYAYTSSSWAVVGTERMDISQDAVDINYDATNSQLLADNVQDAIDEVVEDVFGDESYYWCDMLREKGGLRECSTKNYGIVRSTSSTNGNIAISTNVIVMFFDVNAGEKWKLQGLGSYQNTGRAYAFYSGTRAEMGLAQGFAVKTLNSYFISGQDDYVSTDSNYSAEVTIPVGAKCMAVEFHYTSHITGVETNIYKWAKRDGISIADKTGRLIEGWIDDSLYYNDGKANTYEGLYSNTQTKTYAVGDTFGIMVYHGGYGSRMVRVDVREGDKLLLDTYSPQRYSLVFTDTDYVITSISEERRLYGVYTAPSDGYAYIIDVLYRDNFIYDKAHGYLAYMAHDSRMKNENYLVKVEDYYNEYAPRRLKQILPLTVDYTPTGTSNINISYRTDGFIGVNTYATVVNKGKFILRMFHYTIGENMAQTSMIISSTFGTVTDTGVVKQYTVAGTPSGGAWGGRIVCDDSTSGTDYNCAPNLSSVAANKRIHLIIDKCYIHTFDSLADAKNMMDAIANGKYDVTLDGFLTAPVNLMENAIGNATVGTLGYDILAKGATIPVDNDGVAYGITLKGTAGRAFGASTSASADQNLVYLPVMDWSNFTGDKVGTFELCKNLVTIPDIVWSSSLTFGSYTFYGSDNLKQVGNLTPASCNCFKTFSGCTALEKVGNIKHTASGTTMESTFENCYSLKEIGTISDTGNVTTFLNAFRQCVALEYAPDLDCTSATSFENMFYGCRSLKAVPVLSNTGNVTNMSSMFRLCKSFTSFNEEFDTSSVKSFGNTFYDADGLVNVVIDCSSATYFANMFSGCNVLENVTLTEVPDDGKVTGTSSMFSNCGKLKTVTMNYGWFSNCSTISAMFQNCTSLESIIGDINCTVCTNMSYTFQNCLTITQIGDIDSVAVTDFTYCFSGCNALTKVGSIDLSSATNINAMFTGTYNLKEIKILNIGKSSVATYDFTALTNWGNDNLGDGYDSLIDTISEIYDRTGGTKGTIKFSANTYDQLSTQQKNAIVAKNYDLYRGSTKYTP